MAKRRNKTLAWLLIVVPLIFVTVRYMGFMKMLSIYNVNYALCTETGVTFGGDGYRPSWGGDRIQIITKRGAYGSTPQEEVNAAVLADYGVWEACVTSLGIDLSNARCEVLVSIGRCEGSGCSGLAESEYPVGKNVPCTGTLVATDHQDQVLVGSTSGGVPFSYVNNFDCILDTHYPVEAVAGEDLIFDMAGQIYAGDPVTPPPTEPVCGNGVIESSENCANCSQDYEANDITCVSPSTGQAAIYKFLHMYAIQLIVAAILAAIGVWMILRG